MNIADWALIIVICMAVIGIPMGLFLIYNGSLYSDGRKFYSDGRMLKKWRKKNDRI